MSESPDQSIHNVSVHEGTRPGFAQFEKEIKPKIEKIAEGRYGGKDISEACDEVYDLTQGDVSAVTEPMMRQALIPPNAREAARKLKEFQDQHGEPPMGELEGEGQ